MEPQKENNIVRISSGSIVAFVCIVAFALGLWYLRGIAMIILASVVIASALEPAIMWWKKRRVPRVPAAVIMYATIIIVIGGLFYAVVPPLLNETAQFVAMLPEGVRDAESLSEGAGGLRSAFHTLTTGSIEDLILDFQRAISSTTGTFLETLVAVFGGALSFVLIFVIAFYLSVQEAGVANFLRLITPAKHEHYVLDLWGRSQAKIGFWLQGQILLGVIVGVIVYLGLTILGIPNALLLAFLAGVFEIIPVFGPILAAIPAVAIAFSNGGLTALLLVAGLYLIIQQFENHLIYPLVVKKVVGVPPLLVIISLIVGFELAGIIGALISVPTAAALIEYINDVQKRKSSKVEIV